MENGKVYDGKGLIYAIPRGLSWNAVPEENQIVQISDGQMITVDVADSAVAEYVEEYIGAALEGEY